MIKKLHDRTSALPKLLWLMMLALLPAQLSASITVTDYYDFTFEYEGANLRYTIIDEDTKTVSVAHQTDDIPEDLIIPSEVSNGNDTYSVTTIGEGAFCDCSNLTSVAIPNSVTNIGAGAFCDCSNLTSVAIPNSVTVIGSEAFISCISLISASIPSSVTNIGEYAFYGCYSLVSVSIPDSVTTIGEWTFYACKSLTSVTIPNSVTTIGKKAFQYCDKLTSVTIPNSITSIGESAFSNCSSLTSVSFQSTDEKPITIKSGVFDPIFDSGSVKILTFKGNYTIEESAFEGIDLQLLYFYGTSYIAKNAFHNCNAAYIYLQDCQGIEEYAFATDKYPYTDFMLWCFNDEPPYVADSNAFSGLPTGISSEDKIFVPTNSVDKYQKAYGWDYFYRFTGMGEIKNLTFSPSEVHLDIRKSISIEASADMTGGYEITESQWITSDEEVVGINQSGTIQAKASGMAMIYFRYTNNYYLTNTANATLVTVGDVDFSLDAEAEQGTIAMGESTGVKLTYGGQGYTVESEQWATSDAEIATVDENGVITGVATGEATITLTVNFDNGLYATREIPVTVTEESGIDNVLVNGSDAPAEYYNLNGVRVANPENGFYIKRQGGKATKVLVK